MEGCWNCHNHRLHFKTKSRSSASAKEIIVVGSGHNTYLWLGNDEGVFLTTVSGEATLSKMAKAILKEIGR